MVLPNNVAQLANWCASSAAHALFTFVREETDFIVEWEQLQPDLPAESQLPSLHTFPTRKILGGGDTPADDGVFEDDADAGGFSVPVQDFSTPSVGSSSTSSQSSSTPLQSSMRDGAIPSRLRKALPTIEEAKGEGRVGR